MGGTKPVDRREWKNYVIRLKMFISDFLQKNGYKQDKISKT